MARDAGIPSRRRLLGAAAVGGLGLLGGCASARPGPAGLLTEAPIRLAPVRAETDRIMKITVCLRPFRAQGPRLDVEQVGDKTVVHNYGHGGSGWSLSWGSSTIAVKKALSTGEREVAVIGCGALGLTSAILAQQAGAKVTIYAKELMPDARSARATGTWSPDSRIALASAAGPDFPALWEEMCRTSFRTYQSYLGLPGDPVVWNDRYTISDISPEATREQRRHEAGPGFVQYQDLVRDLTPRPKLLAPAIAPFDAPYVQRSSSLMFNVAALGRRLMNDFLVAGGRIETREFQAPSELAGLPQKVIINCTGYGARALWKDETITPVRGQIAWLIPQPDVTYGAFYKNVTMLSRTDGIIIQDIGQGEDAGFNDPNETPDRPSAEAAVATIAELYTRLRAPA